MVKRPFEQRNGREIRENHLFGACVETEPAPVAKHTGNSSNLLEILPYGQNLARKIEKLVIGCDFYRFGIDLATGKVLFWRLGTETKRDQPRSPNCPNTFPNGSKWLFMRSLVSKKSKSWSSDTNLALSAAIRVQRIRVLAIWSSY